MPTIKLAIMSMQFPITGSCEKSKYLHASLKVQLLDFECSVMNLKFM